LTAKSIFIILLTIVLCTYQHKYGVIIATFNGLSIPKVQFLQ
jgi:hypothetical protein